MPPILRAPVLTADLNLFTSSLQGLAPASGGGTSNYLRADGTWAAPGGGGSPGGSSGQVQFNASGSFGGAAGLNYQPGASPNVTVQAQNAAYVPFVAKGAVSQTADLFETQDSSGTSLFSFDNYGRPIATSSSIPTIAAGAGAGSGASASISGNDVAGVITLNTGTGGTANANLFNVTFGNAYASAPKAVITRNCNRGSAASTQVTATSTSTTGWAGGSGGSSLSDSTTYTFYYLVVG